MLDIKHDTDTNGSPIATAIVMDVYVTVHKDIGFTDAAAEHMLKRMGAIAYAAHQRGWREGTEAQCALVHASTVPAKLPEV